MALLTPQDIDTDGLAPTLVAAAPGGDTFANSTERIQFRIVNGDASPMTVTISATNPCNHGFTHDIVQVIAAGEDWTFGPFDRERFNDASGLVSVTYTSTTSLTVGALNIVKPPAR